jgi:hypothetical protein
MADFYMQNQYKHMFGGVNLDEDNYDEDELNEDNADEDQLDEDDFFAGGNVNDNELYGGAKAEGQCSFSVVSANLGTYEGGRFISSDAYGAAKKASTAIFRHLDIELGLAANRKLPKTAVNAQPVPKNKELIRQYGSSPINKVSFILERTDRSKPKKYYSYEAIRVKVDDPIVVTRKITPKAAAEPEPAKGKGKAKVPKSTVTITFNYKITIKPAELDEEYVQLNAEHQKKYNAKKRAEKRKAENPDAVEKPKRKTKTAPKKVTSVADIIKALTSPAPKAEGKAPRKALATKAKVPKAPKAEGKAPKAPKAEGKAPRKALATKAKAPKAVKGGGFCSFF